MKGNTKVAFEESYKLLKVELDVSNLKFNESEIEREVVGTSEIVSPFAGGKFDYLTKIVQDESLMVSTLGKRLFTQKGFVTHERWQSVEIMSARVMQVNEYTVDCECLLSKENRIFEMRSFKKTLFVNLPRLEVGVFVKVKLSEKPGSVRIDIIDGSDLNIEKDFVLEDIWSELLSIEVKAPRLKK